jgi:DNA polymerase-3 subunit epsilon
MTAAELAQSWLNADTIILDTETTGLSKTDQVIEIAAVNGLGAVLLDCRIKPTVGINPHAQAVHGISAASLANAPAWSAIHARFTSLIQGKTLIAFNAKFDLAMLQQSAYAHRRSITFGKTGCAMQLAAERYGSTNKFGSISLAKATVAAGVTFQGAAHSALGDALTTLALIKSIAHT